MKIHSVQGAGGVKLHVREWGQPGGIPLLLIHGWSQSLLCWTKQHEGELRDQFRVVAVDLRGHGMSEVPLEAEQYVDGDKWADDVAAIIDQLTLDKPILVGWSYGGFVISDYVRKHGQNKIAGINFVGAAVVLGKKASPFIGPGFQQNALAACEADLPTNIAAIRRLLRAFFVTPISQDDFELALAFNMVVHPQIRAFLIQRELDFVPILESIEVPVLVTHGRSDNLVLPAMADLISEHCKSAETSWYDGVGHAPFLEEPKRFDRELARFVKKVRV